jgi:hypothetical protein
LKDRDINLLQHKNEAHDGTRSNDSKVRELEIKDGEILLQLLPKLKIHIKPLLVSQSRDAIFEEIHLFWRWK